MNNKGGIATIAVLLLVLGLLFAVFYYVGTRSSQQSQPSSNQTEKGDGDKGEGDQAQQYDSVTPIQHELNELSAKMITELRNEDRLNLSMVAQLRAYQEMMRQIEVYAKKIERDIDIIEEISKNEFQEDVRLQASLFTGKKAELVAKHLEEFRASRVGAILAKMKEKEASAVLDVWAKRDGPKVSAFYREVVAAYLNNKRRDTHPELFDKLAHDPSEESKNQTKS